MKIFFIRKLISLLFKIFNRNYNLALGVAGIVSIVAICLPVVVLIGFAIFSFVKNLFQKKQQGNINENTKTNIIQPNISQGKQLQNSEQKHLNNAPSKNNNTGQNYEPEKKAVMHNEPSISLSNNNKTQTLEAK